MSSKWYELMVARVCAILLAAFRVRCYPPNIDSMPNIATDIYRGFVPAHIDVVSQASSYSSTYILNCLFWTVTGRRWSLWSGKRLFTKAYFESRLQFRLVFYLPWVAQTTDFSSKNYHLNFEASYTAASPGLALADTSPLYNINWCL